MNSKNVKAELHSMYIWKRCDNLNYEYIEYSCRIKCKNRKKTILFHWKKLNQSIKHRIDVYDSKIRKRPNCHAERKGQRFEERIKKKNIICGLENENYETIRYGAFFYAALVTRCFENRSPIMNIHSASLSPSENAPRMA